MEYNIVPANETHVTSIYDIQTSIYDRDLWESKQTIHGIVSLGESLVVFFGDKPVAYTLAHFIDKELPMLDDIPDGKGSIFFIHDMCVSMEHQGRQVGNAMHECIVNYVLLRDISKIALVSLPQSINYWKQKGFLEQQTPAHVKKSYGINVVVMSKSLQDEPFS